MTAHTTGDKPVRPPWLCILPAGKRRAFLDEYATADPAERERLLWEWQRTPAVYADRRLARRLRRPVVT